MSTTSETSDQAVLELLRGRGAMAIAEICAETEVTANAVRQRLTRLMGQGLIGRAAASDGAPQRGRPTHRYSLTDKARRQAGDNFADLAMILWREMRSVKSPEVRRGLLQRVADAMALRYQGLIAGATVADRMQSVAELFAERRVPLSVKMSTDGEAKASRGDKPADPLPILLIEDCPYPQLAEEDRGICAVEKMVFSKLLSEDVQLTQCRLDGHNCCQFAVG